jgi:membrane protein DedA with SNARE-associated domain
MPDWMRGWPVLAIFAFFLLGALLRSQAIYWLGRGVAAGVLRSRWSERLDSPRVHRATRTVETWGMPIVPLAFLTVGFQSAVFAATGLLRVHWLRYTLWTIPGALVWAAVWGGGGIAVVTGMWALAQTAHWAFTAAIAAVAVGAAVLTVAARRRRARTPTAPDVPDEHAERPTSD